MKYEEKRLEGAEADTTEYIIQSYTCGEYSYFTAPTLHGAINFVKYHYSYNLSIEHDFIKIWEVLPTGHSKVVWGFWGWHYELPHNLSQGRYPDDAESIYAIIFEEDY